MKFKLCYYKSFEKTIYEKISFACSSINKTQNEILIGCYINDISNFESNLTEICGELDKRKYSGLDGQVWGADFLKDRFIFIGYLIQIMRKGRQKYQEKVC